MEGTSWGSSHNGLGTVHNGVGPSSMEMTINDPRLEGVVSYHGTSNSSSPSLRPSRTPEGANCMYRPPGGGEEGEIVRSRRSFTETDEELTEEELSPRQRTAATKKQWDFKSSKSGKGGVSSRSSGRRQSLERRTSSFRALAPSGGPRPLKSPQDAVGGGGMVGGASLLLEPFRNGGSGGPMLDPDPDNAAKAGSDVASEEDESKKAILESARFQQQLKAIADSGSSDPDSDVEPPGSAFGVHVDPRYGGQRLDPYGGGPQAMMVMAMTAGGAHPYLYRGALVPQRPPGGPGPHVYHQEEGVVLQRHSGEKDFGFSVANAEGGGVYVKGLRPGGPAQLSRRLQPLDRIVQVIT